MSENFERLTNPPSLEYQAVKERVEGIEHQSEQLRLLISEFDQAVFPGTSLVVDVSANPPEPWDEHEEVRLSGYEDGQGNTSWLYEINPALNTKEKIPFDELLGMAMHEVRHRVQRELNVDMATSAEKFTMLIDTFPKLKPYKEKILAIMERRASSRIGDKLPPHVEEQEFDAKVAEVIGVAMMKHGMNIQEVSHQVIKPDFAEMLSSIHTKLEKSSASDLSG